MNPTKRVSLTAVTVALLCLCGACGVPDRRVSLADGGAGDAGPGAGDASQAGDGAAADAATSDSGAAGKDASSPGCMPGVFDDSRFDEACFQ